jgi:hypothetical protein
MKESVRYRGWTETKAGDLIARAGPFQARAAQDFDEEPKFPSVLTSRRGCTMLGSSRSEHAYLPDTGQASEERPRG